MQVYQEYWTKMFKWNYSATRAQFWVPTVLNWFLLIIVAGLTGQAQYYHNYQDFYANWSTGSMLFTIFSILIWIANLTVKVRRLHDRNHTAWYLLWTCIPFLGTIIFYVTMLMPSLNNTRWPMNQRDAH